MRCAAGCAAVHTCVRACVPNPNPNPHRQVNVPLTSVGGCPVGLGLIGPPGSDEDLLALTEKLAGALREAA
jgi:Asp-tRNA(Asn)/Glu-tRNA(Gln) amidotransferase A subunit family amidase